MYMYNDADLFNEKLEMALKGVSTFLELCSQLHNVTVFSHFMVVRT